MQETESISYMCSGNPSHDTCKFLLLVHYILQFKNLTICLQLGVVISGVAPKILYILLGAVFVAAVALLVKLPCRFVFFIYF